MNAGNHLGKFGGGQPASRNWRARKEAEECLLLALRQRPKSYGAAADVDPSLLMNSHLWKAVHDRRTVIP